MKKTVTILRTESRPYKKDGKDEFFNSVSMLIDNELVDVQASKEQVEFLQKNKDRYHSNPVEADLEPKGYFLKGFDGYTTPL